MNKASERACRSHRTSSLDFRWLSDRGLGRVGQRRSPFASWARSADLLEAFIDSFRSQRVESCWDEGLAAIVSGLLGATGCAILSIRPEQAFGSAVEPVAVTGSWESTELAPLLESMGCDWMAALGDAPMLLVRRGNQPKLRSVRRWPQGRASALALPLRWSGAAVGALLVVYATPRTFSAPFVSAAKLMGGFVEMELANQQLARKTQRQGEWISRLTSDVERMAILLRSAGAENPHLESAPKD